VFSTVSGAVTTGAAAAAVAAGRGRRRNRTNRPGRQKRSWRLVWIALVFFTLFGTARRWVRDQFGGSGSTTESSRSVSKPDDDPDPAASIDDVPGLGNIGAFVEDKVISALESAVRRSPRDAKTRVELAKMYLRRAKATNDPAYRKRASDMFDEALRIDPDNDGAKEGLREIAAASDDTQTP
jgi:hypothetical protein